MRPTLDELINTADIEAWPARLLRARSSSDARRIAAGERVLRRKRDGRFLAVCSARGLDALVPGLQREPGLATALAALDEAHRLRGARAPRAIRTETLEAELIALGVPADYAARTGLDPVAEPDRLALAGRDRYARPLWLLAPAARAWSAMRDAAAAEGIVIEAISGYRSRHYQRGIFERKRARGLAIGEILAVNAAPGFSEHHGGCAIDIGAPDEPPAEESFEGTPAFAWLAQRAGAFGFRMSYPRGNRHGVVYEPWHWCWQPARAQLR